MTVRYLNFTVGFSFLEIKTAEEYAVFKAALVAAVKPLVKDLRFGDYDVDLIESAGRLDNGTLVEPEVDEVDLSRSR